MKEADLRPVVFNILQNSGFPLLFSFVGVYLVVYMVFGMNKNRENKDKDAVDASVSVLFDLAVVVSLIGFFAYKFGTTVNANLLNNSTQELLDYMEHPLSFFTTITFIVSFYVIVYILGIPTNTHKPIVVMLMGLLGWGFTAVLVIHNALKILFQVDLLAAFRDPNWVDDDEVTDLSGNKQKVDTPEVFNIANNAYTYDDSQAICRAYDSRLATYDEIESAYTNGAEWCNYGWSADQMAFFPTQKQTWKDLQGGDGKRKNNCGRPGVNGGFFANPNIKFGVNCFGKKPAAKKSDVSWMESVNAIPFPRTDAEKKMDEKVKFWKDNLSQKAQVSSFNKDKWSRY